MTPQEILKLVRQWWWILVICPVLAILAAFLVSSSMTDIYEAEATVMVEHHLIGGGSDLASIQAAERRTQTFNQLVTTRSVLTPVIEQLDLDVTLEQLRSSVIVSHHRGTQLLSIAVRDPDPAQAALIANTVTEEFRDFVRVTQAPILRGDDNQVGQTVTQLQEQIRETEERIQELEATAASAAEQQELEQLRGINEQLEQALATLIVVEQNIAGTEANVGSHVILVESAAPSTTPVSPRVLMNMGLAGVLGMLLGAALVVGVAYLDDNVKTEQDIRRLLNRPVVGTVPQQDLPDQMESIHAARSLSGEIFRGLRTNLQFTMVDRNIRSIVVNSMKPGEGKTTVAANLAIVLAQGGQRVILVDADMRRPRVHSLFHKVRNDRGLSNLLLQSPAVIENVIQSTAIKNLKIVATGPIPPNPPDLFGSARMKSLVAALEDSADIVVFDSPPVAISESLILSSLVDGILFVVRAGANRTADVVHGVESAAQTGVPILGIVLNGVRRDSQSAYRVYQQYYPLVGEDGNLPPEPGKFSWVFRLLGRSA
jgi:polysaccharide biosynthesis transport protein